MPKMSDIRAQFPMYDGVSDDQLLLGLHKKYYSDIPIAKFSAAIERDTEKQRADKELTDSMSTGDKFFSGVGKAAADLGRFGKRVGNMVGLGDYDQAAAQEDARLDKPLMNTGAGLAGNIAGNVALTAVPGYRAAQAGTAGVRALAAGPGFARGAFQTAAPYLGAAGSGAAIGAATTPDDMGKGATLGAAFGAGGELAGRVLPAAWNAGKAVLVEPFTQTGRERILKRTLQGIATNPDEVARVAGGQPRILTPGSRPTLAEATMDPGIASLERQFPQEMAETYAANNAARVRSLESLGETPEALQGLQRSRAAVANENYTPVLNAAPELPITPSLERLMQRPVVRDAFAAGRQLAENLGESPDAGMTAARGLHYAKLALDTAFKTPGSPLAAHGQRAIALNKQALLQELEHFAPGYNAASQSFRTHSAPINAAETGNLLFNRSTGAMPNAAGDVPVMAGKLANALRNGDDIARSATNFDQATLRGTLGDTGVARAEAVAADAARAANAQTVGRGVGSPTAQNLAAMNALRRLTGPLGMPESFLTSQFAGMVSGALGVPYRLTQDQSKELLVRALQDPRLAARIMNARDPRTVLEALQPFAAQAATQLGVQP